MLGITGLCHLQQNVHIPNCSHHNTVVIEFLVGTVDSIPFGGDSVVIRFGCWRFGCIGCSDSIRLPRRSICFEDLKVFTPDKEKGHSMIVFTIADLPLLDFWLT